MLVVIIPLAPYPQAVVVCLGTVSYRQELKCLRHKNTHEEEYVVFAKTPSIKRMTRQRRLMMEILRRKNWHPTAEEIYGIVRMRIPKISLGTVYRNLDMLSRDGIIQKVGAAGAQRRYDGNPIPHFHVQCKKCMDVWDAEVTPESWSMPVLSSCPDFQVTGVRLIFEGYCSQCRHEENEPGE